MLFQRPHAAENDQSVVRSETLLQSTASWDSERYKSYPSGQPVLSILRITVPPHTKLEWHGHPMPSAYLISGELTLERKKAGKKPFTSGQASCRKLKPRMKKGMIWHQQNCARSQRAATRRVELRLPWWVLASTRRPRDTPMRPATFLNFRICSGFHLEVFRSIRI
jgi:hypothetical protein